eukprot:908386-Pelagomonas_calceolata.AAC.2
MLLELAWCCCWRDAGKGMVVTSRRHRQQQEATRPPPPPHGRHSTEPWLPACFSAMLTPCSRGHPQKPRVAEIKGGPAPAGLVHRCFCLTELSTYFVL